LGTLYESCENQTNDAIDAYSKAVDLDPTNALIKQRLELLKSPNRAAAGPPPAPLQPQQPAIGQQEGSKPFPGQNGPTPAGPPPQNFAKVCVFRLMKGWWSTFWSWRC
jgi:glucose repression mediator protein